MFVIGCSGLGGRVGFGWIVGSLGIGDLGWLRFVWFAFLFGGFGCVLMIVLCALILVCFWIVSRFGWVCWVYVCGYCFGLVWMISGGDS